MKVLWFTNNLMPDIAIKLKVTPSANEGWLVGMLAYLSEFADVTVACPQSFSNETLYGQVGKYSYSAYCDQQRNTYNRQLKNEFISVIQKEKPDVIHIMGTEFPHSFSVLEAADSCGLLDHTVVSIQGLVSVYAEHYEACVHRELHIKKTFRDFIKREGLEKQLANLKERGNYEELAIRKCRHVIGRTSWDRACTKLINPDAEYHFNNENLRPEFYTDKWSYDNCEEHSIFFSQMNNPLKGFHRMIKALAIIKKSYPDVKLYAAGSEVMLKQVLLPSWRKTSYLAYIDNLVERLNLIDNVEYCGTLDAARMKKRMLNSNVFVCASAIENSPNSVGEAMILGLPVVSSDVGGVRDLIEDGKEGYIYPETEDYMLAYRICSIFENRDLAESFSEAASQRARRTHDSTVNAEKLIEIYKDVMK